MKLQELKKWLAIGVAMMLGVSLTACAKETAEVQEPEAVVVTESTIEPEEETEEFFEEEEEPAEEVETVAAEEETAEQGQISFQEVTDSYDQLVDLYNKVYELYNSDDVPQDDGVEEILSDVSSALDEIAALNEEDVPTDDDKMAVIATIGNLGSTLNDLIDPIIDAANENVSQQDYYNRMLDLVQQNYDYMNTYFNSVWDHLAQYGGTQDQIDAVILARDAIGDIDNLSSSTPEELETINDCINSVVDLLDAICGH